jgi:hypothetical protein
MPALTSFDYALVRVVPHVERGERINVGAVLFCRECGFLEARVTLDVPRLLALAPDLDLAGVQAHLEVIPRVCRGGDEAGPIGKLTQAQRFHWLVAPRSTVVQPSCVHSGLCADPATALDRLFATMVAHPSPDTRAAHLNSQPDTPSAAPPGQVAPGGAPDTDYQSAFLSTLGLVVTPRPRYAAAMAALEEALTRGRTLREVRQAVALALRALGGGETPPADDTPPNG